MRKTHLHACAHKRKITRKQREVKKEKKSLKKYYYSKFFSTRKYFNEKGTAQPNKVLEFDFYLLLYFYFILSN